AAEPAHARTLFEVLDAHVRAHGDRPHIRLWISDGEDTCISYAELDRAAHGVALGLIGQGLRPGERAAIMLPTGAAFFQAFLGVLLAGAIPVPIYPPFRRAQIEDHLRRQAGILRNAEASFLITEDEIRNVGVLLHGLTESLRRVVTVEDINTGGRLGESPACDDETVALIQYTSGSTGAPKGVVLTHANLLANIRSMGTMMEASSADIFVSWLPLYHDMGLIGAWLGCLYYGAPTTIMPPLAFLADPARWLRAIHHYRATLSAAPNFAFELCMKNVRDADVEGLDLGSLRMVVNGAEPVSPGTIARFTERFRKFGFRPESLAPVYGLAENSVGLAFPPVGRKPLIDRIEREALSRRGIAVPVEPDDLTALEFVACGQPIPGHEVRVVDAAGHELPDRQQGRLEFRGASATAGYFRNEEKTRALFDGNWLDTGDLAYIAGGDVYITGRVKDLIIRAGRNIYPHELEEFVAGIEGVRKGCVAVFASHDARTGTERLVVLAETRITEPARLQRLRDAIADASTTVLDRPPDEIVLAPPHTVPKTSSGKIRRSAAREIYESGAIGRPRRALWLQLARLGLVGAANRLRRWMRLARDTAYSAYWWGVLCLLAALAWLFVVLLPRRSWRHGAIRLAARAFLRLTGTPLDVRWERRPPETGAMLVANHSSYLDALVVSAAVPGELRFVAKEELASQIVAGTFLRRIGTLFVRRTDVEGGIEDTKSIRAAARSGARIVSFPEGTLTRMPGLLDFRLGAFNAAAEAGVPVVPVTILGTRSILRGGQWFPRRGRVTVHIAEPLLPDGTDFAAALRLRDEARTRILAQCGEPDLARERVRL
ncbi:MAG: AMP-binding protein, partial [Methyloligellaceae bacterium]